MNSNPNAFPSSSPHRVEHEGMTLLDYFAGKALQGFLSKNSPIFYSQHDTKVAAENSYLMADAMLRERAKRFP